MSVLRIRVGCALDASAPATFEAIHKLAQKTRKAVQQELDGAMKPLSGGGARGPRGGKSPAVNELGQTEKEAKKAARAMQDFASSATAAGAGAARSFRGLVDSMKAMPASIAAVSKEAQRELAKLERQQAKAALGIGGPAVGRAPAARGGGFEHGARQLGGAALGGIGMAAGVLKTILQAQGVDLDLGSVVGKNAHLQTLATQVSNSGYMANDPRNSKRVDAGVLANEVRQTGVETGTEANVAMEGLQQFVGLTGDLQTGRESLKDFAVLAKATGSSLDDVAAAAGNVSNDLADTPDKAQKLLRIMQAVAAQGKLGAVEMRDLASQMAGLAAAAPQFAGDAEKNIAILGGLAQEARQKGGSKSAAQAVTSVQSFVATFGKGARLKGFEKAGIDVYEKDAHGKHTGKVRDARDIIRESLIATTKNGTPADPKLMNKLFMDVRAQSVVRGYQATFQGAYSATQGTDQEKLAAATKALNEEFERTVNASMGVGEVEESFKRAMQTDESRAAAANGQLAASVQAFTTAIGPATTSLLNFAAKASTALVDWNDAKDVTHGQGAKDVGSLEEIAKRNAALNKGVHEGTATPQEMIQNQADTGKLFGMIPELEKKASDAEDYAVVQSGMKYNADTAARGKADIAKMNLANAKRMLAESQRVGAAGTDADAWNNFGRNTVDMPDLALSGAHAPKFGKGGSAQMRGKTGGTVGLPGTYADGTPMPLTGNETVPMPGLGQSWKGDTKVTGSVKLDNHDAIGASVAQHLAPLINGAMSSDKGRSGPPK